MPESQITLSVSVKTCQRGPLGQTACGPLLRESTQNVFRAYLYIIVYDNNDARSLSSGVSYYRLEGAGYTGVKRMLLVR